MSDPIAPKNMKRVFLLPGEYHVTKRPEFIATLLGSCVAICIYNTKNGSAAMNHYLHDLMPENDKINIGRYGDSSISYVVDKLFTLDPKKNHYQAKMFGGGAVVSHLSAGMGIGTKNVAIARKILKEYGIPIVEENVEGKRGMKIYFNTDDCSVITRSVGEEVKDFTSKNIRVLVVDDSAMVRNILVQVINDTDGMEVVGQAADAYEARDKMLSLDPDVISLDIIMPGLDGLRFLEKIMQYKPKPVVIVSTIAKEKSVVEQKARKIGAIGVINKDTLEIYKGYDEIQKTFIPMIRAAANTNVNRRL